MQLSTLLELEAGRKLDGRIVFQGLNISIENKAGSTRSGIGKDGKPWQTKMKHDYGYIRMTKGVDGDQVDCFIGPNEKSKFAYIVHQQDPKAGIKYDEDKVMLGFTSAEEAIRAFKANYDDPKFFGSMTVLPMEEFKKKVLATKDHPGKIHAGYTPWEQFATAPFRVSIQDILNENKKQKQVCGLRVGDQVTVDGSEKKVGVIEKRAGRKLVIRLNDGTKIAKDQVWVHRY